MFKTMIQIIAKNPPSIALAIAGLLAVSGQINEAHTFLSAGILMQIGWIVGKYFVSK